MLRENATDLLSFLAVARAKSFTKAAGHLGVSQSALSHAMRDLEARLGVRLLARTTRSVSTTEAGERLAHSLAPRFEEIEAELVAVAEAKGKVAGLVRITATEYGAHYLLWPKLMPLLARHRGLKVEVNVDYALTDIVAQRYDAGVRMGEDLAKDMISVRIGPDERMAVVAAPSYLEGKPWPKAPRDLHALNCINLRLPTCGDLFVWEFEKDGHAVNMRVDGQLIFSGIVQILTAALAGFGVGYMPEQMVRRHLEKGRLKRLLSDWCPPCPGFHLYYPTRRQLSPAFSLVLEALRWKP